MLNKVYAFEYTPCIYESYFKTMSIHRTKKGAYKAMRDFLETEYTKWRNYNLIFGVNSFKFGYLESWRIIEVDVLE